MILSAKQRLFWGLVTRLLIEAHMRGYQISKVTGFRHTEWGTLDEKGRFKRVGHPSSLHGVGLAVDIDLWKHDPELGWRYCTDTEDHKELGEWWEQQHELCRWGGRFDDGNHYSLTHNGMQ